MPDAPLIEARDLTKRYGEFVAVDGIDFSVERGETFGFLGPNGAGKSSTMRMIGAVSPASGGTLRVLGRDPERDGPAIRARLGVVPQDDNLDLELDVGENLHVYGRFFGLPRDEIRRRTDELLEFVQLADRREARVDSLSGGMKRRLTIARALINEPELMLLDEPTTGLDPQARHALWDRLYRLKQRGVTLVLTTHYMDEAEQLCDRLVVMDRAKIVAEGSPRELIERYVEREVVELRFGDAERRAVARRARRPRRGAAGPRRDRHRRRGRGGRRGARARARAGERARAPLDARGRLPPAHGPEPDRLMDSVRRTVAVVGWQAHSFRRLWRGVDHHLVPQPDLLPPLDRRPARQPDRRVEPQPRRSHLPAVRRARAARDDRDADRGERDDVPGQGGPQVAADVPRRRLDARSASASSWRGSSPGAACG